MLVLFINQIIRAFYKKIPHLRFPANEGFLLLYSILTVIHRLIRITVDYAQAVGLEAINLLDYRVIIGIFIGGMLTFLFSAFTMESVSKAAYKMIEEVRRQFREKPGIMKGEEKPDYTSCVAISTTAALHEMLLPGVMAVISLIMTYYNLIQRSIYSRNDAGKKKKQDEK